MLAPAAPSQLDREIAFVRALAKDLRLIELARLETEDLAKNHAAGGNQEKIAQLAVEVAYYGARCRNDRAQQRTLFQETIARAKELIATSSSAAVQLEARATLANAAHDFGLLLREDSAIARASDPDRVQDLRSETTLVCRAGIEAAAKVLDALRDEKDEGPRTEYFLMWMKQAVMIREQGRADPANRNVLVSRAVGELEQLVLEVGEETAIGLRGLFEIAQCKEVDGGVQDAIDGYQSTIQQIVASLEQTRNGSLELPRDLRRFLFEMLQEVYAQAGELMMTEGAAGIEALFAAFRQHVVAFGEPRGDLLEIVGDEHGHRMLLVEARARAESGNPQKVSDALTMARRISDRHPSDHVGLRARAVMRDILDGQRELVPGAVLVAVAKGELQNRNHEAAIKILRRAIPALTSAEQQQVGLEAFEIMGLAFAYGERHLEAMQAFGEGLRRFGARHPEHASEVADALERCIAAHRRLVKNDPAFGALYQPLLALVQEHSKGGGAKVLWKQANDLFLQKRFLEAAEQYGRIPPDFPHYEAALVNIARAQAAAGAFAAARTSLASFRAHVGSSTLPAGAAGKQQVRAAALAEAEFTEVAIAYTEARGAEELKISKDLTKYPTAIAKAQAFVSNFAADGERNLPQALEYLGRLHTDLGSLDQAEAAYTQLVHRDAVRASRLAAEMWKAYQDQANALDNELHQATDHGMTEASKGEASHELATLRSKLAALGMDYIATSPKPQLAILVGTLLTWEQLGDWPRTEQVARKTLVLYGAETAEATRRVVDLLVRPKLCEALLHQRRFTEAHDLLVVAEQANPMQWELKRQICRALGGWFEFNQSGGPVKEPGLDRPAEAYTKYYTEYRSWALRPEVAMFSLEWYRFHWEAYWFARQAGAKDSKMKEIADALYRIARATDDFATLKSLGAEGDKLFHYFQANR